MTSVAETKRERRPHRKSRTGCHPCKQRKIKCDESRPSCLNCKRREIDCEYTNKFSRKNGEGKSRSVSESAQSTFRFVPYTKFNGVGLESGMAQPDSSHTFQSTTPRHFGVQNLEQLSERIAYLEGRIDTQTMRHQEPPRSLTYADMALLHHYYYIPNKLPGDKELLETSFNNPHLLHLVLGFSALHWARQEPHRKHDLVEQADKHYGIGMRGATQLLSSTEKQTEEEMELVCHSTVLIGLYHLALGPQTGEYMGFSDHEGRASFLIFIRGVRIVRENKEEPTQHQPQVPIHTSQSAGSSPEVDFSVPGCTFYADSGYPTHLENLRHLSQSSMGDPFSSAAKDASVYLAAIAQLEPYFEEIYPQPALCEPRPTDGHNRLAFGWLYRASDGFMNRLQEKAPLALAIFACFAVVLKRLETAWFVDGWPEHIMAGVWKFLRPDLRDLIRWPMQELEMDQWLGEGVLSSESV
ncbi:hypothetical protein BKA64DRAFT_408080 [Cadophora sp. MPI-SDFR-AT-0126]|nr:hypothetical protein BKA64DRAFT_408080 [Leotiomycetes sp. MPI-SDFR-AT-0126]